MATPTSFADGGTPIYNRPFGFGFSIVVEAAPGLSGRPVARSSFEDSGAPDLQIQVTQPLGNGSPAVCDNLPTDPGGVPPIAPPSFGDSPVIEDRLNDFGCQFIDGSGNPRSRPCQEGCVLFETGELGCVATNTTQQFCGLVPKNLEFPAGDTLVTVRVRDTARNPGPTRQLIVRVPR